MKKKLLFVFNPKSGKGLIKDHLVNIVDIMTKGRLYDYYLSYAE